jgi:hypothetical protein
VLHARLWFILAALVQRTWQLKAILLLNLVLVFKDARTQNAELLPLKKTKPHATG